MQLKHAITWQKHTKNTALTADGLAGSASQERESNFSVFATQISVAPS